MQWFSYNCHTAEHQKCRGTAGRARQEKCACPCHQAATDTPAGTPDLIK